MATLADRILAARNLAVELRPASAGKPALGVTLRRPPESRILQMQGGVSEADVCTAAVAWSGFTEAELLGPEVGSDAPAEFSADAWRHWVQDNVDAMGLCAERLNQAIAQHIERKTADRKN